MADQHSVNSQEGLVHRRGNGSISSSRNQDQQTRAMYQPGQPIGYLAARGTPYERKYFTRKLGFCCLFLAPPILLVTLAITLVPVLYAIAQHALHTSVFHVISSNITGPTNNSFPLTLEAQVSKLGIFPASVSFREPVQVYWNTPKPDMREVHLGSFNLAHINAAAGHATVNQATFFEIADVDAFSIFAGYLISQEEFTWRIHSDNLHVEAFSFFPTYKNLAITKDIVIKGINNFGEISILDLQLPGADPQGGIEVITTTNLNNPSPFGIQVGTLNLDLYYKGLYLGPVSVEGLNITAGTNVATLKGRVLPYPNNQTALDILGDLFTNYINSVPSDVIAVGRSVYQDDGSVIGWLSAGVQQLNAHVNFVPPEPIDPIKGITIETINLQYNTSLPYNPVLSSQNLTGVFQLPFGFPLNITQLATQLNIVMNGALIGSATGPFADSDTVINVLNQGQTAGDIALTLPPSSLILPNATDAAKKQLIEFQNAFVYTDGTGFETYGAAKAVTDTPVGKILLDGIKFNVSTGLKGLAGLTRYPTIINSVDVTGGSSSAVDLAVGLTVVNPSNLNLSTGDVSLELFNHDLLGVTTLPNLILLPGENKINATATFDPNVSPYGLETLNRFISGLDTTLNATGFNASSQIVSLAPVLEGLRLNTTLPALSKSLVQAANLTVLSTTGIENDVANSVVQLANPFSSALEITHITANASAAGIYLANIDTALQFNAKGDAVTASPNVPLTLNLYPPDLFSVLRVYAIQSGQNPAYIDGLVQLAGFSYTPPSGNITANNRKRSLEDDSFVFADDNAAVEAQLSAVSNTGIYYDPLEDGLESEEQEVAKRALALPVGKSFEKRDNLYTGFNLETYVAKAFSVATADLQIVSDVIIGEYGTTLTFQQTNVPLGTDDTLFLLLPVLAKPIVQGIVDGSILNIDRVTITEATPNGFTASLQGALTNAGPFDAIVSFPAGLEIYWNNQLLTQTSFPNITLTGDVGAELNVQIEGSISDVDYFTSFLEAAITDPSFVWDIRGANISVAALGIDVDGITLNKGVQLTGLNGLQGQVIINSFDLPYNDPAGGIHLTAITTINNPAQVGVALTQFGVDISMGETDIGPSAAAAPFTLQALAVTELPLAGRIQEQTSSSGLADLSTLFTRFVHNQNTQLLVAGMYAGPSDVAWLNNGIKALKVNVMLPAQDFQVIRVISLNQLSLYFTVPTAWSPATDTDNTTANFFLPFAFPVDITQVSGPFTANYNGQDMAVLNIPTSPTSTNVEARILTLTFQNIPFAVFGGAHSTFSQFAADFVAKEQVTFNLHGSTDASLSTAAGQLSITDIPFNLNTNLLGLQGLNAKPALVSNLDVYHGYPTYLQINVDTTLWNPSTTTVGAGDVAFAVQFTEHIIGSATISDIVLSPGNNTVPTEIQYMPIGGDNVAAGQVLLENYVQNVTSTAIVLGTSQTTPIESLEQGLSQIHLSTQIPPLEQLLVQRTFLEVPRDIAQNGGIATVTVTLNNPFTAGIHILNLFADANFGDITVGYINQNLAATNNIINAPGHEVTTSQQIPFNININPKNLIEFILAAAAKYGVSLGPLPPFFQKVLDLPGDASTQVVPVPDTSTPPCSGGDPFDTLGAILTLIKPLQVSIPIQSTLKLDDYQTNLDFIQQPVPVGTDNSILYLVGPAAAPLIQIIVNEATLEADRANATALTNNGFTVSLLGKLLTDAPADAYIEAPDGLTVNFQGQDIATLTIPPLCTNVPDGIPNLQITSQLTILPGQEGAFANFAYYLLTEPSFQWTLHSDTVIVRTLGIVFSKVQLSKTITLDAFNGLPGITITSFETNGDDPNMAAIDITTGTEIPSQAALGVELGTATFTLFFGKTNIGQASSHDLFLAYKTTTAAVLTGFLRDQSNNEQGEQDLGVLFTQYLAGENSTLTIQGLSVVGPASGGQPIDWLTTAFKRFSTTVVLPGHIYQIIYAITLSDLEVYLLNQSEDFHVPASNKETTAVFSNPLVFSLSVINLKPSIVITYEEVDTASLDLPTITANSGTSHNPNEKVDIVFGFTNQTINAISDSQFATFFGALTDTASATFGLKGSTDVLAQTVIGQIPIQKIPFNVTTSLAGINSFNHNITITNSSVDKPTSEYLGVDLNLVLTNPSNITVHTNDISLPTLYQGNQLTNIGRATIATLNLVPGTNYIPSLFELMIIDNNTDTQEVVRRYVSPKDDQTQGDLDTIPLQANGGGNPNVSPPLSPYGSLNTGLAGVTATTALTGIGSLVIEEIEVYLGPSVIGALIGQTLTSILSLGTSSGATAAPAYVTSWVGFTNALPSGITFNEIFANIYKTGTTKEYATFTNVYGSYRDGAAANAGSLNLPPNSQGTQGHAVDILLTNGVGGSLDLLGSSLDLNTVINIDLYQAADSSQQYNVPGLNYIQKDICTSYWLAPTDDPARHEGLELLNSCAGGSGGSGSNPLAGLVNATLSDVLGLISELGDLPGLSGLTAALEPVLQGILGPVVGGESGLTSLLNKTSTANQQLLCGTGSGAFNLGGLLGLGDCSATTTTSSSSTSTSSSSSSSTSGSAATTTTGQTTTTSANTGAGTTSAANTGQATSTTPPSSSTKTTTAGGSGITI